MDEIYYEKSNSNTVRHTSTESDSLISMEESMHPDNKLLNELHIPSDESCCPGNQVTFLLYVLHCTVLAICLCYYWM